MARTVRAGGYPMKSPLHWTPAAVGTFADSGASGIPMSAGDVGTVGTVGNARHTAYGPVRTTPTA